MKELLSDFLYLFTGEHKEYSWKEILIGLTVITAVVLLVWVTRVTTKTIW